jgi:hypothetical protein
VWRERYAPFHCSECREFWLQWEEIGFASLTLKRRAITPDETIEAWILVCMWLDHLYVSAHTPGETEHDPDEFEEGEAPRWISTAVEQADRELTFTTYLRYLRQRRKAATRVLAKLIGVSQRTIRRRLSQFHVL